jgi:hypothetical protein
MILLGHPKAVGCHGQEWLRVVRQLPLRAELSKPGEAWGGAGVRNLGSVSASASAAYNCGSGSVRCRGWRWWSSSRLTSWRSLEWPDSWRSRLGSNAQTPCRSAQWEDYSIYDDRKEVTRRDAKSWVVPPVAASGDLLGGETGYELLVGYTRLGNLLGMLDREEVKKVQRHLVWVGRELKK